jgi:hypothetical protein
VPNPIISNKDLADLRGWVADPEVCEIDFEKDEWRALLARLDGAEKRVRVLEEAIGEAMRRLVDGGWCVDHAFVASDDHPADRSCQFIYDDFDGTECAYPEEDHFLGAGGDAPLSPVKQTGGPHDFVQSPDPGEQDCADCGVMDDFHGGDAL